MKTFHNDPEVKARYVQRMRDHIAADELVRGVGWESNGTTRGCAVGCTLNRYDHSGFEDELGVPEWAARLMDHLHENISPEYANNGRKFALAFLEDLPVGVDMEPIQHRIHLFILNRNLKRVKALDIQDDLRTEVLGAIEGVIDVRQRALDLGWDDSAARSARAAADSAARSARSAWWSAWSARSAESAARSAESAWWSAWWSADSAARSAEWAADSAARSAEWAAESAAETDAIADALLRLFREEQGNGKA